MHKNIEAILPEEVTKAYHFIKSLMETKSEWKYKFIPNEEYEDISDNSLIAKIYWDVTNLLNKFNIESIYTPIRPEAIEDHQLWIEIKHSIDSSINKFSVALKSGRYE